MLDPNDPCYEHHVSARKFFIHARSIRTPLHGTLCLTNRCNFKCTHCYLEGIRGSVNTELPTAKWLSILDEMADSGSLFVLFTGGEPFIRADFQEIYIHAKKLGLLTEVFSNGSLITEDSCQTLSEYPPRHVEITLYGATRETYTKITGIPESYDQCMKGIERLLKHGVRVAFKTVMMTLNQHEYDDMVAMAEGFGGKFRMDAAIFPRINGDTKPINLRIPAHDAVQRELADPNRRELLRNFYEERKGPITSDKLYTCGTGLSAFYINPQGQLQPCSMVDEVSHDLKAGTFKEGWEVVLPTVRDIPTEDSSSECKTCSLKLLCGSCPATTRREKENPSSPCEYACNLGQERYRMLYPENEVIEESVQ